MYCNGCGTKNPEGSEHCFNCGAGMVSPGHTNSAVAIPSGAAAQRISRESPWKRGDVCTRGSETVGFVVSYTPDYLEIRWHSRSGGDNIERVPAAGAVDILRLAHADAPSPDGRGTNLHSLEVIESLEAIEEGIRNRTFKNDRDKRESDDLIRRSFATGCVWDTKHQAQLITLAIKPKEVGIVFKIQERLHRPFCTQTRPKKPREILDLTTKNVSSTQTFNLSELRQDLAEIRKENPDLYKMELEPVFDRLEAKFGNDVPVTELHGLQQLISSKLADVEEKRQEIINRGAKEGKTIEIESLRRSFEASKAAYTGPDRDAYVIEIDRILGSLLAEYGSHIPIDHAYKIMQKLEAGLGSDE